MENNNLNSPNLHVANFHLYADAYARHINMAVFPLVPRSKRPITKNGFKDASTDSSVIAGWWMHFPNANIGCATGLPSGIVVLDIDPKPDAALVMQEFERKFSPLPCTPRVRSGRGGYHYYFRSNVPLPCRVEIIPGVDFRADGGYIVLPPSIHENGEFYEWEQGCHLNDLPIADIPSWLVDVVKGSTGSISNRSKGYFKEIAGEVPEGRRTVTLASVVGHLLARRVDPNLAKELVFAFNEVNFRPPLPKDEVVRVLDSIAGREIKKRQKVGAK